jgi:glycosyltransferase involved in cell wall biosynthesis
VRIALVGTRGIPAAYSGVETAVEHLAEEMTDRGHEVTVYCRTHMVDRRQRHAGARLVHLPTVRDKYLDTIVHTAVSTGHLVTRERPDAAVYFIGGNAPLVPVARLAGIPSVLQVDGLDSERAKWPRPARAYLRAVERMAPRAATIAITDSEAVADQMEERFGRRLMAIPYGADVPDPGDSGLCERLGVEPGRFTLFVGRLVPENNAHVLVAAHARLARPDWPLVVVGDAPYEEGYIARLKAAAGPDVRFPGYVFNPGYSELLHRAGVMCVPTEVGGTHPVVVESLAAGAPLLVSDHAPNLEVTGEAAARFALAGGQEALARALGELIDDPARREALGRAGAARAAERFSWARCAERYLALLEAITSRPHPRT